MHKTSIYYYVLKINKKGAIMEPIANMRPTLEEEEEVKKKFFDEVLEEDAKKKFFDELHKLVDDYVWLTGDGKKSNDLLVATCVKSIENHLNELQELTKVSLDDLIKDPKSQKLFEEINKIAPGDNYPQDEEISTKTPIDDLISKNKDFTTTKLNNKSLNHASYLGIYVALAKTHCIFAAILTGGKFLKHLGAISIKDAFKKIDERAGEQYKKDSDSAKILQQHKRGSKLLKHLGTTSTKSAFKKIDESTDEQHKANKDNKRK